MKTPLEMLAAAGVRRGVNIPATPGSDLQVRQRKPLTDADAAAFFIFHAARGEILVSNWCLISPQTLVFLARF
jgi:hypothetical protein